MKIIVLLCIFAMMIANDLNAQIEKTTEIIEPAMMECRYRCTQKLDTLGTEVAVDTMVLRVGKNTSQFYACSTLYIDSMAADPQGGKMLQKLMMDALMSGKPIPGPRLTQEYHYKKRTADTILTYVNRKMSWLVIEKYERQDWQLTDSTKSIGDYTCKMARCRFRGRDYEAWYTTDIAVEEGPWKFGGLPGLIMEVYDTQKHYHYAWVGINFENLRPVCFYKIGDDENTERITREQYLKDCLERYELLKTRRARRGQKIAYDLMERDYH